MPKQTKQQRIDELEAAFAKVYKKVRYGLLAQVKRSDRNAKEVGTTAGNNIIEIITEVYPEVSK